MFDIFLLECGQFFEILVDIGVEIVKRVAVVTRFRAEEDHQNELNATEWKKNPESVLPAQISGDRSSDDRNQAGNSAENTIEERNSNTTFMHKVQVADDGGNNCLESTGGETLYDSADEEEMIVVCTATDDCSNYTHHSGKEEYRSFAVFTGKSTDKGTSRADDEKLITSELGDSGN